MINKFSITAEEKNYLKELAKKYYEYSQLPVMEERIKLWYDHNALKGERPPVVMELGFQKEIMPEMECKSEAAQKIEYQLQTAIVNHELIDDDKVITPDFGVPWNISLKEFNIDIDVHRDKESGGFAIQHPITDLKKQFHEIQDHSFSVDKESSYDWKNFVEEQIGDILEVKFENNSLVWNMGLTSKIIRLMGMEAMFIAMYDCPDELNQLMEHIERNQMNYMKWQEKEDILTLNNGNHYAGAGSRGFTNDLPTAECKKTGHVTTKDIWLNMNSQETVGVDPAMFGELFFPYYKSIAKSMGMVYYGCCEPVHDIWDDYISKIPNLKKVSISPWCNEEIMGQKLIDSGVIYSRKPSPNFLAVGEFNEELFATHIKHTLECSKECSTEIIFRDIMTICKDKSRPGNAIQIARKQIDKMY